MKNRFFATLSCLTFLTAAAAFAQSSAGMTADIPFEFRVGEKTLPAGHYHVRSTTISDVLSIRCFECKTGVMIQAHAVQAGEAPEESALVFHRYNQTYFLSRVWSQGNPLGRELFQTRAEREIARNASPAPPTVAVALVRP
jgi:hypothetical protein